MVKEKGFLILCLIHLCVTKEIFESAAIIPSNQQMYTLSDNEIEKTSLLLTVECCGIMSIYFSNHSDVYQITPIIHQLDINSDSPDYVELHGMPRIDCGNLLGCERLNQFWLKWTSSGYLSFGRGSIVDSAILFIHKIYEKIDSLDIEIAPSTCSYFYSNLTLIKSTCSNGTFGESCDLQCGHCHDVACERYTGDCLNGCEFGWIGMNCSENPCLEHICFNEGICFNNNSVAACDCTAKYTGKQCETYIDPCSHFKCSNGGTCYDHSGTAVCICRTLYTGPECGQDIDPCSVSSCYNGGTCSNITGYADCSCASRFTGEYCETYIDPCDGLLCENGGQCHDINGIAKCRCQQLYTGSNCETEVNPCHETVCYNDGTCENINGTAVCFCTYRFNGTFCESYIDPCDGLLCENGGQCNDINGIANCTCPPTHAGLHCETVVDPCDETVCHNGGTCKRDGDTAVCTCTFRFTGTFCESYINPCIESPCTNDGDCFDIDGKAKCRCNGKHKGTLCELPVTDIESLSYKVDKTTLSSYKRRRTSASDTRRSAMYLGVGGVSLISLVILIIVSLDCLPNPRKK